MLVRAVGPDRNTGGGKKAERLRRCVINLTPEEVHERCAKEAEASVFSKAAGTSQECGGTHSQACRSRGKRQVAGVNDEGETGPTRWQEQAGA